MAKFQTIFKRYEKKYIVNEEQKRLFLEAVSKYIEPDKFGQSTLYNIYFDTPDYRLIRESMNKPVFKEKLRIRAYGRPTAESNVFVELKKKYKGVVYKRRVNMPYIDAVNYICRKNVPQGLDRQIISEINYFMKYYRGIRPSVSLFYDRIAYYSKTDSELRITFDSNIRFRAKDFDLAKGNHGHSLLQEGYYVMEIKCLETMPLWLTRELTRLKIFPASYSKYAEAYKFIIGS